MPAVKEALWWKIDAKGRVACTLCPRHCTLDEGAHGFCFIRKNEGGRLVSLGYGRPIAVHIDPIEKKPLNHFLPGSTILSLGTAGCNMGCRFCQNWDLSKARDVHLRTQETPPEEIVALAQQSKTRSIAFTYNEPTIWGEYVIDIARLAHESGLMTVMVTNGYIDEQPLREIYTHIDAANVDLKGFTQEFYGKMTLSRLDPVLQTLVRLKHEMGTWIEITNLMIPGKNDAPQETRAMAEWIVRELGPEVPLHLTAFHPDYELADIPPTPKETLHQARQVAMQAGLQFVYTGNVVDPEGQTTWCPTCNAALIKRSWHSTGPNYLKGNHCPQCDTPIAGIFEVE